MEELKMEKEYDFSNGVRGKLYNKDSEFQLPIYLKPEIESFFKNIAQKQKTNLNDIVNKLLLKERTEELQGYLSNQKKKAISIRISENNLYELKKAL